MNNGMHHRIAPPVAEVVNFFDSATRRRKLLAGSATVSSAFFLRPLMLCICVVAPTCVDAADKGPLKHEAAIQALQISKLAAQNGMQELSLRAFREALIGGPPRQWRPTVAVIPTPASQSQTIIQSFSRVGGAILPAHSGVPPSTFRISPVPGTSEYGMRDSKLSVFEELQFELDAEWQQQKFDPVEVYEAMADVVLPTALPGDVFLYSQATNANSDAVYTGRSIGSRLIEWANRAARLQDLSNRLKTRLVNTAQPFSLLIYQTQLALFTQDTAAIQNHLKALLSYAGSGFPSEYNDQVLAVSLEAIRREVPMEQALPVFDAATDQMVSTARLSKTVKMDDGQIEPVSTLLLASATVRLERGNPEAGRRRLQTYLDLNENKNQKYSGKFASQLRQFQLQKTAGVLLASGHTAEGLRYLEMAARHIPLVNSTATTRTTQQLIRLLGQLPVEQRYQQLRRLCLPEQEDDPVSILSTLIPPTRLPDYIRSSTPRIDSPAAALLESESRAAQRLISTGTLLVDTAKELGELAALITEVESLQERDCLNANTLLAMAYCQNQQPLRSVPLIEAVSESIGYDIRTKQKTRDPYTDLMLCMVALQHDETRDAGRRLSQEIADYNAGATVPMLAEAVHRLRCESDLGDEADRPLPQPQLWTPAQSVSVAAMDDGAVEPIWSVHDGIITHISGTGSDALYLPFPLTGDFDFVVEATAEPRRVAGIGYGGLQLETRSGNDNVSVQDVGGQQSQNTWSASARNDALNETRLRVRDGRVEFIVNGTPSYTDSADAAAHSPWLFLAARLDQQPVWRFPTITGSPTIPRQVQLSSQPQLRGWTTVCFGESRTSPWTLPPGGAIGEYTNRHWTWDEGTIIGRHHSSGTAGGRSLQRYVSETLLGSTFQNLLQYDRPLMSGESVAWEFEYQAGHANVAPALGRTAFLIERDGLRLRHLVSANNWFAVPVENAAAADGGMSGNMKLPLIDGWNKAELSLRDDRMVLSLNGQAIYEGSVPAGGSRQFGFYHDSRLHVARIRRVVLTGEWPTELPDEYRTGLTRSTTAASVTQARVLVDIIGHHTWTKNSLSVVRYAESLLPADRYDFLRAWVLPGSTHAGFRMSAAARVQPPLPNDEHTAPDDDNQATGHSTIVSPLTQLVDVAEQLGKLPDLYREVTNVAAESDDDMRISLGLLALIAIASDDIPAAADHLHRSASILQLNQITGLMSDRAHRNNARWIDVLVASEAIRHPELRDAAKAVLAFADSTSGAVFPYLISLAARLDRMAVATASTEQQTPSGWHAVQHSSAENHGGGLPDAIWTRDTDGTITHWPGHDDDHLFLAVPVEGEFSLECEVSALNKDAAQVGYNGLALSFTSENTRQVFTNPFGRKPRRHWQSRSLKIEDWVKCRIEVRHRKLAMFHDDRVLYETEISETPDPWIFVRCPGQNKGGVRNFKVTGNCTIPRSFPLDTSSYLNGWSPHYYGESVGSGKPWVAIQGVIQAQQLKSSATAVQSVLQYHRPMLEDGSIRYQFYYKRGDRLVHPALGRLAFLLDEADGVVLHQLTDERYGFNGLTADNRRVEPEFVLQTAMPLRNDDWNDMAVSVKGDQVSLNVNGVDVYRRPLPSHNSRIFGLFHFKNQSTVQVRNPVWTGDWGTQLPKSVESEERRASIESQ